PAASELSGTNGVSLLGCPGGRWPVNGSEVVQGLVRVDTAGGTGAVGGRRRAVPGVVVVLVAGLVGAVAPAPPQDGVGVPALGCDEQRAAERLRALGARGSEAAHRTCEREAGLLARGLDALRDALGRVPARLLAQPAREDDGPDRADADPEQPGHQRLNLSASSASACRTP